MARDIPDAESVRDEMKYDTFTGEFGQNQSVSIPAQLTFTDSPTQDTDRFHNALNVHNFTSLSHDPAATSPNKQPYYDGEICSTDHYNRLRVLVFRENLVRLFPKDNYIPTPTELENICHALTIGFRSPLKHTPIETNTQTK